MGSKVPCRMGCRLLPNIITSGDHDLGRSGEDQAGLRSWVGGLLRGGGRDGGEGCIETTSS